MKKLLIITLVCFFTISSCCKIEDKYLFCNVQDPLTELPWLREKIDVLHAQPGNNVVYVSRLVYGKNNLQAFKIFSCSNIPDFTPCSFGSDFIWYNCEGEIICQMAYAFCPVISDSLTHEKLIYKK